MKSTKNIPDYIIFLIIYIFSYGIFIFNKGVYTDDWVYFNMNPAIILDTYKQAGLTWFGYFQVYILSFENSIFIYRIIIFTCFFIAALCLNEILKTIEKVKHYERLFIVIFFMIFPTNSMRFVFTISTYAVCYMLFFVGFWLLSLYYQKRYPIFKGLGLILFFISFSTQSLLVFYILPIIYILYKERISTLYQLRRNIYKYIDFLLLPIIFMVIKNIFYKPYGLFEGLYGIHLSALLSLPSVVIITIYTSFFEVLDLAFLNINFTTLFCGVILALILQSTLKNKLQYITWKFTSSIDYFLLGVGCIIFIFGIVPYACVGKTPNIHDWNSRDQLLVPLGVSIILVYGFKLIFNYFNVSINTKNFLLCLIIVLFVNTNFNNAIAYQSDWYKQSSIIENMKINEEIKNSTTILFKDNTHELNVNDRNYRFYEYTGMMKLAYKNENRFGENVEAFGSIAKDNISYYDVALDEHYNMKNYIKTNPNLLVSINKGNYSLTNNRNTIRLMFYEIFNKREFHRNIIQIVCLEV